MMKKRKQNFFSRRKINKEHDLIPCSGWKEKIYQIIYHSDTPQGKLFDIILLILIIISSFLIIMESLKKVNSRYHMLLYSLEWIISIFFTIEYILRIMVVKNKRKFILSFIGLIDLLSIIPFYLSLIFPITKFFMTIRLLRLLRVFRVFNLFNYMRDAHFIIQSLKKSSRKIYIFLLFIVIVVVLVGSLMYVIEGGENGFVDIPSSIYWAVVTLTTVGYGDISPQTPLGKFLSVVLMLCGYSIIAVPTGIVTAQFKRNSGLNDLKNCHRCGNHENDDDARYCKKCGEKLVD